MKTVIALLLCAMVSATRSQSIVFDESHPTEFSVTSPTYEVSFRKVNGSILSIRMTGSEDDLSLGNHSESLWYVATPGREDDVVISEQYSPFGPDLFSYEWDQSLSQLALSYTSDPTGSSQIDAIATMAFYEKFVDFKIQVTNGRSEAIQVVSFPSDLLIQRNDMESALLPIIPGMLLNKGFFQEKRSYQTQYPGWLGMFIPFVAIQTTEEMLTLFPIQEEDDKTLPVDLGFNHSDDFLPDVYSLPFIMSTWVENQADWDSPIIRLTFGGDFNASIRDFAEINQIASRYPSISDKLGDSEFDYVAKSTFYKFDFQQIRTDFEINSFNEMDQLLRLTPPPGILHTVAFHGRFDTSFPDFLPPDPGLGTLDEFKDFHDRAHDAGYRIMPYINPTWWDINSPTLSQLSGYSKEELAVHREDGNPMFETYGEITGIVVSPNHPFVMERLDQLITDLTEVIPCDYIYEDQIGARPQPYDHNPTALSPNGYLDRWIQHTRSYQDIGLGTEIGFDLMMETNVFFFGSTLLHRYFSNLDGLFGSGNWMDYPLTSLIAKDKVFFYAANVDQNSTFHKPLNATWQLSMGTQITSRANDHIDFPGWIQAANLFQTKFVAGHAGTNMLDFTFLQNQVSQSEFVNGTVIANWSNQNTFSYEGHEIAQEGFLVQADQMIGGAFTSFYGEALSDGVHVLLEERTDSNDSVSLWHPVGSATNLKIPKPVLIAPEFEYVVKAISKGNAENIASEVSGEYISFDVPKAMNGEDVDSFLITSGIINAVGENSADIAASPNPLAESEELNIQFQKSMNAKIVLTDLSGKVIYEWQSDRPVLTHVIPSSHEFAKPGIYLVMIVSLSNSEVFKIIRN